MIGQLVDVEKARAGNVGVQIFLASVPSAGRHEPARIHDRQIGLAKMLREPGGGNQRVHGAAIEVLDRVG